MKFLLAQYHRRWLLRCVRVSIASIYFEFPVNGAAESIVRNHSAHRSLNQQFWMPHPSCPDIFRFMATDVTGKAHESFLLFLFAGDAHFFGINHDHEIAGIDVRGEESFFLSPQKIRGLDRDTAKHLIFRVDDPPFAWDFGCFS